MRIEEVRGRVEERTEEALVEGVATMREATNRWPFWGALWERGMAKTVEREEATKKAAWSVEDFMVICEGRW
jgi:hypothetical protein